MSEKPPKDQRNKYPPPFSMRFTDDERKTLELAAAGRPLAAYIRWLIFKEDMPEMPKKHKRSKTANEELAKLLGALGKSRISQNINQLAKAANSGSLPVNQEVLQSLKDAVAAIKWMRDTLITGMGIKPLSKEPDEEPVEDNDDPEG